MLSVQCTGHSARSRRNNSWGGPSRQSSSSLTSTSSRLSRVDVTTGRSYLAGRPTEKNWTPPVPGPARRPCRRSGWVTGRPDLQLDLDRRREVIHSGQRRMRAGVDVPLTPRPRRHRRDQARDDREREGLVQAVAKRRGDQVREERPPGDDRLACGPAGRRALTRRAGAGSGCNRGRPRTGSTPAAGGRRAARPRRARRGPRARPPSCAAASRPGPRIISVKKIADRQHLGGVLERLVHAAAGAAVARRAGCS